jgi:hypothetical protein
VGKKTKPKAKAARQASPLEDGAEMGGKRKAAPKAKAGGTLQFLPLSPQR